MPQPSPRALLDAAGLDARRFTAGRTYAVTGDGLNTTYSRRGQPVELDSLRGTDMVTVLSDNFGERCNVCRWRFK